MECWISRLKAESSTTSEISSSRPLALAYNKWIPTLICTLTVYLDNFLTLLAFGGLFPLSSVTNRAKIPRTHTAEPISLISLHVKIRSKGKDAYVRIIELEVVHMMSNDVIKMQKTD